MWTKDIYPLTPADHTRSAEVRNEIVGSALTLLLPTSTISGESSMHRSFVMVYPPVNVTPLTQLTLKKSSPSGSGTGQPFNELKALSGDERGAE